MEILLSDIDCCDACKLVFLPSFLSLFYADTVTDPAWGKKGLWAWAAGVQLALPGNERDRLNGNHSAGFWIWWVEYQFILIVVKEHFCGSQCFEPIGKVAVF